MKNSLTIIFLFISAFVFSQNQFPKYYIDSKGDTLGIIITVDQAQKLDNDEDILNLFKKMNINVDSATISCTEVIDNLDNQIILLTNESKDLKSQGSIQTQMVNNLKSQLNNVQKDDSLCGDQSKLKDGIIKDQKKQITKLRFQKVVAYIISVVSLTTLLYVVVIGK